MRNRVGADREITNLEGITVATDVNINPAQMFFGRTLKTAMAEPNRQLELLCDLEYATQMIRVLMRDNDAGQLIGRHIVPSKPTTQLARPKSAVEHDMGCIAAGMRGDQERIALATATQTSESHALRRESGDHIHYFNCSLSRARMRFALASLAAAPFSFCTEILLLASAPCTRIW